MECFAVVYKTINACHCPLFFCEFFRTWSACIFCKSAFEAYRFWVCSPCSDSSIIYNL